jgi:hypothetical protein
MGVEWFAQSSSHKCPRNSIYSYMKIIHQNTQDTGGWMELLIRDPKQVEMVDEH